MRLATSSIHALGYAAISKGQSDVYRLQAQFASQKRINSAADDPSGASRAAELTSAKAVSDQYSRNQTSAQGTLQYNESLVGDVGDLMQSIQETLLQAGNGALSTSDRAQLATQLRSQRDQMVNLANSRDASGRYLFAGFNENVAPFQLNNTGVDYFGDNGHKSLQVSSAVSMPISVSGSDLFLGVKGGNGVIQTAATAANTGNGKVDGGRVLDATGYDGANYSVAIVNGSAGLEVQITNTTTSTVVSSGTPYKDGQAISIPATAGSAAVLSISVSGTPKAGDTFTVGAAQPTNIFDSMTTAIDAIEAGNKGTLSSAAVSDTLRQVGANVSQAFDRSLEVRNHFGSSMQELERQQGVTERETDDLKARISDIVDLDPAKAATELAQAQVALSSSQQIYAGLAKQSLFDYLK
ncbi:flagellar hook-associated protein FlgL [soil metagenome]